jgi:tRNA:m(5)U-54 methyltransferase
MNNARVKIIGAGLAGADAAYFLAERGVKVELWEQKPEKRSPAHHSSDFCELVCSNSLKSDDAFGNACGLLKEEMRTLGSLVIAAADRTKVPAGGALAVDRDQFSRIVTETLKKHPNIEIVEKESKDFPATEYTIVATGPLTSDDLAEKIAERFGGNLYFYDAAAPIVTAESIDFSKAFIGDRYGKGSGDYVNCPLNREEYEAFVEALVGAEKAVQKDFDKRDVFDGCMPVEIMAQRGTDTLRFGMLKPVGLYDAEGKRPYAVLQLRKENAEGTAYNLVGCQTNLKFPEQKRVFSMIPALAHAEFARYGVMHRNTFLNAPAVLNADYSAKEDPYLYFAGQMTGVEGYVESAASGLCAAINLFLKIKGELPAAWDAETVCGALSLHVSTPRENFQPMNANYAILAPLSQNTRDKALKKRQYAERALEKIQELRARIDKIS